MYTAFNALQGKPREFLQIKAVRAVMESTRAREKARGGMDYHEWLAYKAEYVTGMWGWRQIVAHAKCALRRGDLRTVAADADELERRAINLTTCGLYQIAAHCALAARHYSRKAGAL